MTYPPPSGPFGPGGQHVPPAPGGLGVGGPIVVHRARLLPRLALVAVFMTVSFAITGAIVWFSLGAGDGVDLGGSRAAVTAVGPGGGSGASAGVTVPAAWPDGLAPPEDATVVSAVATSGGSPDEQQMVVVYEVPREAPAAVDAVRDQLAAAGLTVTGEALAPEGTGSIAAAGAGREASVAIGPTAGRPGVTTVTWVLRPGLR